MGAIINKSEPVLKVNQGQSLRKDSNVQIKLKNIKLKDIKNIKPLEKRGPSAVSKTVPPLQNSEKNTPKQEKQTSIAPQRKCSELFTACVYEDGGILLRNPHFYNKPPRKFSSFFKEGVYLDKDVKDKKTTVFPEEKIIDEILARSRCTPNLNYVLGIK